MPRNPENQTAQSVHIGAKRLEGILTIPPNTHGLVIFAHGSGSSRFSPRNSFVANSLNAIGLGTLQFDLLKEFEASDRSNVFDIPLLGDRVADALFWAHDDPRTQRHKIGLFGASTGAAAALVAAAKHPELVNAVVSRGGRPDLADEVLSEVQAPTLLIVGGADYQVIGLNERALRGLQCEKKLEIIPGATHLFEEPGTLEAVVEAAGSWFKHKLADDGQHDLNRH